MPERSAEQPVMYGIPNCDTIKKARNWLQQHSIDYRFHDYKKQGTDEKLLQGWLNEFGWEQLINKRGTSWRKLDAVIKSSMDNVLALSVMQENPSIIKRPILLTQNRTLLGFDTSQYEQEFST